MPWWPIMMPSDAVGAPKSCGTPPAARTPSQPLRASRSRWALQGVMSLNRSATPTMGRSKSSSRKPTARSMARLGARLMPWVVSRLRRWVGMVGTLGVAFGSPLNVSLLRHRQRQLALAAAADHALDLPPHPQHRVVILVHDALFQRDDAVVGDLDVLGADLGAALGDVTQADVERVLGQAEPVAGVQGV